MSAHLPEMYPFPADSNDHACAGAVILELRFHEQGAFYIAEWSFALSARETGVAGNGLQVAACSIRRKADKEFLATMTSEFNFTVSAKGNLFLHGPIAEPIEAVVTVLAQIHNGKDGVVCEKTANLTH